MKPMNSPSGGPLSRGLAASLLACAALISLPAVAQPRGDVPAAAPIHPGPGAQGPHRGAMGLLSGRMLDAVNASPEQRAQIHRIMQAARQDLQGQREARRALRQEGLQLFTQPNVDAAAVEALRQRQLAQHEQLSRRMTQAMLDASRVLTPQQRQTLAERMARRQEMMERHRQERRALDGPKS